MRDETPFGRIADGRLWHFSQVAGGSRFQSGLVYEFTV